MLRFRREILLSLLAVGLFACNGSHSPTAPPPPSRAASIEVAPASVSVLEGETVTFRAVVRNAQGEEIPADGVFWRSADLLIAQVDANGVAVALPQHGTTRIIATIGGKEASGAFTSQARCSNPAPVEGIRDPSLPGVLVMARDGARVDRLARNLAQKYGFEVDQIYEAALLGFSAKLTYAQIAQVRCEREVANLSFDQYLWLADRR
jgi:hypothetical protein